MIKVRLPARPDQSPAGQAKLRALVLQYALSAPLIIGGPLTLFFIVSVLSWYDLADMLIAYPLLLIGMVVMSAAATIVSGRLYHSYNREQAYRRYLNDGIPGKQAYLPDYADRPIICVLALGGVYWLLNHLILWEILPAFWLLGGLMTLIFIVGLCFTAKVAWTIRRWANERQVVSLIETGQTSDLEEI